MGQFSTNPARTWNIFAFIISLEGQQDSNPEHSATKTNKDKDNQEHDHGGVPLNCSERTERLMAAQSAELLAMDDEFKAFRKNWEKNFRGLQERHKKEQERLFELDNCGYEMWGNCLGVGKGRFKKTAQKRDLLIPEHLFLHRRSSSYTNQNTFSQ